MLGQPYN